MFEEAQIGLICGCLWLLGFSGKKSNLVLFKKWGSCPHFGCFGHQMQTMMWVKGRAIQSHIIVWQIVQQLEFGCKGEADNDLGVKPAIASWVRSPHFKFDIRAYPSPQTPLLTSNNLRFRWKGLALKLLRLGGQWCGCEAGHCQLTEGKALGGC